MKYKIVTDSSCEFPAEWRNNPRFERVALGLEVDGNINSFAVTYSLV